MLVSGGTGSAILGNAIFQNAGLGIDLGGDGVTPNDPGDGDTAPNDLQNFPVVTLAYQGSSTTLEGILNSTASTTFSLEFFANGVCDPSDHGEGEQFLGSTDVTTDRSGDATFAVTLSETVAVGSFITATVADPGNNTSEFSPCIPVAAEPTFTVNASDDSDDGVCSPGHCSLREAINSANARSGTELIAFDIPGAGPHTIQPQSALPTVTDPVVIDGYTQPGASPNTNAAPQGLNTVLMIELDGSSAGNSSGLLIRADNSVVRGLVINRFGGEGVAAFLGGNNVIEGNFIGTDVGGTVALGNGRAGVSVSEADDSIGGTSPERRNLISGNGIGIGLN